MTNNILRLFRPKDKTFRWKFDGDDTVRLPSGLQSGNGIYPVCRFFYYRIRNGSKK
jgi:hypothetical protein